VATVSNTPFSKGRVTLVGPGQCEIIVEYDGVEQVCEAYCGVVGFIGVGEERGDDGGGLGLRSPGGCEICQSIPTTFSASLEVEVKTLERFEITVTSRPVPGQTNSLVSGQPGTIRVRAIDNFGQTFTEYRGTVRFSSGDAKAVLPSNYTYTSSDNGVHSFNVTLKTVAGTSATRDLTVRDDAANIQSTQKINVWFRVRADLECCLNPGVPCNLPPSDRRRFGSYFYQTFCTSDGFPNRAPNNPQRSCSDTSSLEAFVALPAPLTCRAINVRVVTNTGKSKVARFEDRGSQSNNPYWNTGNVSSPNTTTSMCLSDGLFQALNLPFDCNAGTGRTTVFWRFN